MSTQNQVDNRTPAQKISDAERGIAALFNIADNLNRDNAGLKEFAKLLNNKVSALVKAIETGQPVNDETLSRLMIEASCDELAAKVKTMVAQGSLKPTEQVDDDSFVVGQELDDAGNVTNPRIQFALFALKDPNNQARLKRAKAEDIILLENGKFKILEVYQIQPQTTEQATPEAAPEAAPATEAPATQEAQPEQTAPVQGNA